MRRVKIFIIILIITLNTVNIGVLNASAFSPGFELHSRAALMVNLDTNLTVFKLNEFERIYPASTIKIMTALIVLDNVSDLNQFVKVTNNMNHGFGKDWNYIGAGVADFVIGQENLTYLDCLYALMIHSACDAANILADNIAGSIPAFVDMMNKKAAELNLVNTHFVNPHGLHDKGQYSCAWDLFQIAKYAYEKHPRFVEIVRATEYTFPANSRHTEGIALRNTNRLLQRNLSDGTSNPFYYEFARGIKTGSIDYYFDVDTEVMEPGNFNLVSIAVKNDFTYLLVTLGAPFYRLDDPSRRCFNVYDDHVRLFDWAFDTLEYKTVLSVNNILRQVTVINGTEDRVQLRPAADYSTMLPKNLDATAIEYAVTLFQNEIEAPIAKGEILGFVELKLNDEVLIGSRINLVAYADVGLSPQEQIRERVSGILDSTWFRVGVAIIAALILFVVVLRIINSVRRKKRRRGGRRFNR